MVPLPLKRLARRAGVRTIAASLAVRMSDGRTIAVEEFGDPAGPVVLYFHGWPACRLEAGLIPDLPVRLLAFDRPGYGASTPHPGRTLLDWARDVDEVARRLGLDRFDVVGLSGGAPYAAVVAAALPERVSGLCLVSPIPPPPLVPVRGHGIGHLFRLGRHPRLAQRLFTVMRPLLQRRLITPRTVVGGNLPDADRQALDPATLAALGRVWREGFRRGIHGALSDAQIYARDWGFRLEDVTVPSTLWFGADDSLIPRETLAPYGQIPGLEWRVLPGEGHYSLPLRHGRAILSQLTGLGPTGDAHPPSLKLPVSG